MKIVVDTNVLVAAAYNARSASRRIIDAVGEGRVVLIVSPAVLAEYDFIVARAVRSSAQRSRIAEVIERARVAHPTSSPRVVPDDPQDDKFLAAALAGEAEVVVTNDRHILELDRYEDVCIMRPGTFARQFLAQP
jgi:putative PIN family toxin of toxin-antitoxin system